jgi:hypothetical protein
MPDLVASLHRSYHRLVDLALRVDPTSALNRGRHGVREVFLLYLDDGRARALLEGDQGGGLAAGHPQPGVIPPNPPHRNWRILSRRSLSLIAAPP